MVITSRPCTTAKGRPPIAQCRPQRLSDLRLVRQVPRLKLRAQPVHVGEDLAPERPALRSFGGVGAQQVGQPVLLMQGLLQVVFEFLRDRLGCGTGGVGGRRVGLENLAVHPDRGRQLSQHGGQPGAGLRLPDRAVLAVDACAVDDRTSQHAHVSSGSLERVHPFSKPRRRVAGPEPPGVQPDAFLGLAERVVEPLDLAAQRPGTVQPFRRAPLVRRLAQAVGHLAEQVGHLAAQVADRVLGGLHPQRREDQSGR